MRPSAGINHRHNRGELGKNARLAGTLNLCLVAITRSFLVLGASIGELTSLWAAKEAYVKTRKRLIAVTGSVAQLSVGQSMERGPSRGLISAVR